MIDFRRRPAPVDNAICLRAVEAEIRAEIASLNLWILRLDHAHLNQELRRRVEVEREISRMVEREP